MKAIWQGIYDDIKGDILEGTYPFQSFLPSEAQLVQKYECSHNTLRRALTALADEGLVQPIHGKGVRVIWRPRSRALFEVGGIETYDESVRRMELDSETKVTLFEQVKATEKAAHRTGFEVGSDLIHLERVRSIAGCPVIHDESYFLASDVQGLDADKASSSIYRYLEQDLGLKIAQSSRQITVEPATKRDYELLDLPEDCYMAVVSNQVFTAAGEMFEYTCSRHRPDYFIFHDIARRK